MSDEWVLDDKGVWRDERGRTKSDAFMEDEFWPAKSRIDAWNTLTPEQKQEAEHMAQETDPE
jgi:hypothetical protein